MFLFPLSKWRNWGSAKNNYLPKIATFMNSRARIFFPSLLLSLYTSYNSKLRSQICVDQAFFFLLLFLSSETCLLPKTWSRLSTFKILPTHLASMHARQKENLLWIRGIITDFISLAPKDKGILVREKKKKKSNKYFQFIFNLKKYCEIFLNFKLVCMEGWYQYYSHWSRHWRRKKPHENINQNYVLGFRWLQP